MQASFFTNNRQRLLEQLAPNSLVALAGFGSMQRDDDEPYAFQQESNFWYLCGIAEPDWLLIIDVDSGEEWLVAQEMNFYKTMFMGGLTPEQATNISGVANVLPRRDGKKMLKKLLGKKKRAYTIMPQSRRVYGFQQNSAQRKLKADLKGCEVVDLRLPLAKMRAIKQPVELEALQQAIDITVDGMIAVYKELKHYTYEYEVDAQIYYEFRRRAAIHGFDPIVASGAKTCIMHAPAANDPLQHWLLLDVGARVRNYSADIARTVPLGQPTERWLQVYAAVERMHDHFLGLLKPGASVKEVLVKDAYLFVGEEMRKLGILDKIKLDHSSVFKFMPHSITHGLGIDVHDPLGRPETFQTNMVLTDEVGIYLPDEGFGIRIENDIVITEDGARNMAGRLPITLSGLQEMLQ